MQGFELFFGGEPFGRDLAYLASLVADGTLDPQLAGELSWARMPEAMELVRSRSVAGKVALTIDGSGADEGLEGQRQIYALERD